MVNLETTIEGAIDELTEMKEDESLSHDQIYDRVPEIVDGNMPIYYVDMLDYASDNIQLALTEPEYKPDTITPINLLKINIFDHISAKLYEALHNGNKCNT